MILGAFHVGLRLAYLLDTVGLDLDPWAELLTEKAVVVRNRITQPVMSGLEPLPILVVQLPGSLSRD